MYRTWVSKDVTTLVSCGIAAEEPILVILPTITLSQPVAVITDAGPRPSSLAVLPTTKRIARNAAPTHRRGGARL